MSLLRRYPLTSFFGSTMLLQCVLVFLEAEGKSSDFLQRLRVYLPALLAMTMMYVLGGTDALKKLGKSLVKFDVAPKWWLLALLYAPVISVLPLFLFKLLGLKDHVEYDPGVFENAGAGFFKFVVTIAVLEEISWVSFGIEKLQKHVTPFVACILGGGIWGLWYVPLNEAGIQVAGQFPSGPMVFNFMAIGAVCGWLYYHTRSAILVAVMQTLVNYASLSFPVLPRPGEMAVYYVFIALKAAFAFYLFWAFGPKPLFRRDEPHGLAESGEKAASMIAV